MMKRYLLPLIFGLLLIPNLAAAKAGGTVESLQMPAWYERDGSRYPLTPGIELKAGDIISTGNKARALLRMEEGSIIKVGADASLSLTNLAPAQQQSGAFAALLNVTRGAFRFTTTQLGQHRKRDIDVKIGAVTIGIRGTDIWGRSLDGEDLFALIEGKVSVQRDGEAPFTMSDPLHFIVAEEGKPTTPVTAVDMDTLAVLAQETELQSGEGIINADGRWAVNMMSLQNADAAEALKQKLNNAGYGATLEQAVVNDQTWLRVRIQGFASKQDAASFANSINNQYGIHKPWLVKF